ncbi:thioredoxin family protein [Hutsoniella sourekii]
MKKFIVTLLCLIMVAGGAYYGYQYFNDQAQANQQEEQDQPGELNDSLVNIPSTLNWKDLSDEEKKSLSQELDKIHLSSEDHTNPTSYSQVKAISSREEYIKLSLDSANQDKLLYFGFDDCPYCKAFLPKLNLLAAAYDLPIYYYDVHLFGDPQSQEEIMTTYDIETVPYAFKISNGKPETSVHHLSSMAEIEDFVSDIAKNQN